MRHEQLDIADPLADFINSEVLPASEVDADAFWSGLARIVSELGPRNAALLAKRDELQDQIDAWHVERRGQEHDGAAYADFLRSIGYLDYHDEPVEVSTSNVDPEIASVAGAQLVVPLDNARYALNAGNARWGSLYDALYGTDVISESDGATKSGPYNPVRGDKVVAWGRNFLDTHFSLLEATHASATKYFVENASLVVQTEDGSVAGLAHPERFVGYTGDPAAPSSVLFEKNGLAAELMIDAEHAIGRTDAAGVSDIIVESAVTTIMDCEDSVSAVDLDDKLGVYRNWHGLMQGTLTDSFERGGETVHRALSGDRHYLDPNGDPFTKPGRSLMLIRNVGPHLTTDIVTVDGNDIYETFLDALVTVTTAKADLLGKGKFANSRSGSIYVVKPKMHGPAEVQLACDLFTMVEEIVGLEPNTVKIGIMDEERRTSLGLKAALQAAKDRVVFINTGFLDRTGDEIHTSMEAGPMVPKSEMKAQTWLGSYENSNVDTGLESGLRGRAQIGKGMWAMPSEMAEMMTSKVAHPMSGASTAWVPSPTAATLHATHYFDVDVSARQQEIADRDRMVLADMVTIPTMPADRVLTDDEIQLELDNNLQAILGYVVRWVGQGVGCSTVPNMDDVGLMEDLATLRISSQHVANWLHHDVVSADLVRSTMERMAAVVDTQNAGDAAYAPMATDLDASIPFQASLDLVFKGREQKNGYTEAILRARRRELKAS